MRLDREELPRRVRGLEGSPSGYGRCLFLTGRPGCGKTTLVRRALGSAGVAAGGFYTEEVREGPHRAGFDIVTLAGLRAPLSRVGLPARHRVGRYGVDVAALEAVGVPAVEGAISQGRVVVIDEVGKMELFSQRFRDAVQRAVREASAVLGVIMLGPHPWAEALKGDPRVTTWEVTPENREAVLRRTVDWLRAVAESVRGR